MSNLVDTSVWSGVWPFKTTRNRRPAELGEHLKSRGVSRAWIAPAEAVLAPDPMRANDALLDEISGDGFFVPVAVVDPALATWRRDAEERLAAGFRAVKIAPSYRSCALDDPRADELADLAAALGVPLCIQVRMLDERAGHPKMKVPGVDAGAVGALARRHTGTRFLACGAFKGELEALSGAPNVWVELSNVESGETLRNAAAAMDPRRIVFGSHSPLYCFEAAAAKLDVDAMDVPPDVVDAVRERNAAELLRGQAGERGSAR